MSVDPGRARWLLAPGLPTDHRDQVLVVGALVLVPVGERPGSRRRVAVGHVLLAGRVLGRLSSRGRLGVDPGHDDDPVVVARVGNGGLDLVVLALLRELAVEANESLALLLAQLALICGPDLVAVLAGLRDRVAEQGQRILLTDHTGLARGLLPQRRSQRARLGHLAPRGPGAHLLLAGVGEIGGPFDVAGGEDGNHEHRHCGGREGDPGPVELARRCHQAAAGATAAEPYSQSPPPAPILGRRRAERAIRRSPRTTGRRRGRRPRARGSAPSDRPAPRSAGSGPRRRLL
jgi:hypothetical protein